MTINWDGPYIGPIPIKPASQLQQHPLNQQVTVLRFLLFFARGDVPTVALGLTNGHWTALALLAVALPLLVGTMSKRRMRAPAH